MKMEGGKAKGENYSSQINVLINALMH